ncbi:unnamed protein product [Didymodactylos carnosus]|uniref:HAT C-terminal dimerisation domain-containing protein n=1 Tax=Didymodactylos carnosus TaxID=1234261 RepID=A0A814QAJ9_9BILA|nr:unnamed protein product [Didymodactylos carnosus]CAF1125275.1 unnamed protein product [Didymodactylos carnosus]CAF3880437.1 unnamed protein product [Didymodactylos carnosus]CAF3902538.1 unnamed protein product [Didymodactylos carnosus]
MVICVLKLRKILRTSESLFKYNRQELDDKEQANQENNRDNRYNTDDLVEPESEVEEKKDQKDESVLDDDDKLSETENNSYRRLDEFDQYLALKIDKNRLSTNPLELWCENQRTYPILSKVARKVHSIPATMAAVERQFSSAGLVVTERRSSRNPEQIDNILLVRIVEE